MWSDPDATLLKEDSYRTSVSTAIWPLTSANCYVEQSEIPTTIAQKGTEKTNKHRRDGAEGQCDPRMNLGLRKSSTKAGAKVHFIS